jgi:N-acetyl-alpha-D-muramate 1-phosphate uridylyltransferase
MKAMLFAAGRGERLRPLTDGLPKPLLSVFGKPLIDWHLEKLCAAGILDVVINVSYLAEKIIAHVGDGAGYGLRVRYSHEPTPLEAGGGLATAVPLLGDGPIAVVSADIFSDLDYAKLNTCGADLTKSNAKRRAHWWLVPPRAGEPGGEFSLQEGRVISPNSQPLTLASIGVLHTSLLADWPRNQVFKLLPHYQAWVANDWVGGTLHTGQWENVTSALDLARLQHK